MGRSVVTRVVTGWLQGSRAAVAARPCREEAAALTPLAHGGFWPLLPLPAWGSRCSLKGRESLGSLVGFAGISMWISSPFLQRAEFDCSRYEWPGSGERMPVCKGIKLEYNSVYAITILLSFASMWCLNFTVAVCRFYIAQ